MTNNNSNVILLTTLLVCCIYSSCTDSKQIDASIQVIKVDIENKQIEKAVTIKEIIPLETSKDCLIGYTTTVFFWNNRIILLDDYKSKSLFVFNEKGKLVFKSAIGKGPGEVASAKAININRKDSTILLYDETKSIFHQYDFNGNYLSKISIPRSIFIRNFFQRAKDTLMVYYALKITNSKGQERLTTWSIYTNNYTDVKHLEIYNSPNKISAALGSPVALFSDGILFVAPWDYTIYELNGNNFRIKYSIDFGDAALTSDQIENLSFFDLIPIVHEGIKNKVGSLQSVFINENNLLIRAEYGQNGINILYSFKDKRAYNINNYFEKGLLPECKVWGFKDDGSIYAIVEPGDFEKFNKLSAGRYSHFGITSNDNPILISFQIESPI
jgi:hypothetical protein